MKYPIPQRSRAVICFERFKTASLYFDQVIPAFVDPIAIALWPVSVDPNTISIDPSSSDSRKISRSLHGTGFRDSLQIVFGKGDTDAHTRFVAWHDAIEEFCGQIARQVTASTPKEEIIDALLGVTNKDQHSRFLKTFGLTSASLFLPSVDFLKSGREDSDLMITVAGLPMADAESASFEQIVEVRSDDVARKQLQRLRSFVMKDYQGKSRTFIEDDLLKRMDDYRTASTKHGFELLTSSLSTIVDAKTLQATAAGAISAALYGGPAIGLGTAIAIETASVSLTLAKGLFKYREALSTNDVAFLCSAVPNAAK